jgi:hypothetical protein
MPLISDYDDETRRSVVQMVSPILERSAGSGFLGGMAIPEQIDHALGFCWAAEDRLERSPSSALDLGTGGGIPGLVLAAAWPDLELILLDANERRTHFLTEEIETWGISDRVKVVRGRAEEVGRLPELRGSLELVTARSFGSPAVTAECSAPFLARGGIVVVSEPPGPPESSRWPVEALGQLGLAPGSTYRYGGRFGYQLLEKGAETPDRFPRRTGIPAKRPLF